jgi:prevent-host-death family protein
MQEVTISKFKATCLALLRKVRDTGQPILVTKHGEPIAEVRPPEPPRRAESPVGCMKGRMTILGDIVSPFSEKDWEVLK